MKKNKWLVCLFVCFIAIGSLLSGCSNKEAGSKKKDGPIEIEFWYGLGGNLGDLTKAKIKKFNESQDEVKVIGVAQGDYTETYQKLQAAIASKKTPAAVLLEPEMMMTLAGKKALAPLDGFIQKDDKFNEQDFIGSFYKQGQADGKQYGIPAYGTTQVLYYRKDIFEREGISPDVLSSWEMLGEAAAKLTKKEGSKTVFYGWEPMYGPENLIDAALSKGGKILSEDRKEVLIDSPEWIEAWEFFRKAIHEKKTMRIHHGGQGWEYWYKTIDDVMQDRAAGYIGSSGDQGDLDFSKIAAHIQPGWDGAKPRPVASARVISVPAGVSKEEQEAAFKWLKFFSSTDETADWSIQSGYISVRTSAKESAAFKEHADKNPHVLVPLEQAEVAVPPFFDPTNGKILDVLKKAADQLEIEGIPAEKVLKAAKKEAQQLLEQTKK
ncbi:MAG TPA: ABC transporter substrate-binding protein [Bacillaceae bacterium]